MKQPGCFHTCAQPILSRVRTIGVLAILVLLTAAVTSAQDPSPTGKPLKSGSADSPRIFKLTVNTAAAPVPALKYSLLPGYLDRTPGNAVPYYYRALLLHKRSSPDPVRQLNERYETWSTDPLTDTTKEEIRRFLRQFGPAFEELKTAAYREKCDWDWRLRDLRGEEPITFLLHDVEEARGLARLLLLKTRLAVDEGRFAEALENLRIGFQLARDVAEPPTLINALVGMSIAHMMLDAARELIDAPGSPNLYWALAQLPKPLIDIRLAMQQEMALPLLMFPWLKDAETAERSAEEWKRLLNEAVQEMNRMGLLFDSSHRPLPQWELQLTTTVMFTKNYPRAKQELVTAGFDKERVEQMPVAQVIAIHQAHTNKYMWQEMFKWTNFPYAQSRERFRETMDKLRVEGYFAGRGSSREIIPLASALTPAVQQAMAASARLESRIAGLQVLEAMRMHAAANNGKLPDSLDDITIVPVPECELTGRPFRYWLERSGAVLEIPHYPNRRSSARQLEVTIQRQDDSP